MIISKLKQNSGHGRLNNTHTTERVIDYPDYQIEFGDTFDRLLLSHIISMQ